MATARAKLAAEIEREGITLNALAQRLNIKQYTLWRFLNGRTKTITPDIKDALERLDNGIYGISKDLTQDKRIRRALASAWDGSEGGVQRIAMALEALAPLLRSAGPGARGTRAKTSGGVSR